MKEGSSLFQMALSAHGKAMLLNTARFYRVAPEHLLQTIAESYLDAMSEDGEMQRELAEAARALAQTGEVPGCWLSLEGDFMEGDFMEGDFDEHNEGSEFEEGPDDSGQGNYFGNEKATDREMRQSWAEYGDGAANWGERDDHHEYRRMVRAAEQKRQEAA